MDPAAVDLRTVYRLTAAQAAARLGMSVHALYREVQRRAIDHLIVREQRTVVRVVRGKAQTLQVGGRYKFSEAGCDAWVAARRRPVEAPRQTPCAAAREPRPALPMPTVRVFGRA